MRRILFPGLILLLYIAGTGVMCAQVKGESYSMAYSREGTNGHTLVFQTDSLAAMQFPPDAVGETFGMGIFYEATDSTVTLYPRYPDKEPKSVFQKVKDGLISYKDSVIYVSSRIPHSRIYIIDGRTYYEKIPEGSRLLQLRDTEAGPELTEKLGDVQKFPEKYEVTKYSGFEAYEEFGISGVFGVTVINRKKE